MNIKALRRQLIAAIAMVLVALVAMSSATFAWFAANTNVTASTLSMSARSADPFLQIKAEGETDFSIAATFTNAANEGELLKLVSPKTFAATPTWYESISDDPNTAVTAISATNEAVVTDGDAEYMVKKTFVIKNASAVLAENLEAKVTLVTPDGTKLDHAARVLITSENDDYALFDSTGTLITTAPATSSAISFGDIASEDTLNMTVYIYFDGTDTLAKNVTAVATEPIEITLFFSIKGDSENTQTT